MNTICVCMCVCVCACMRACVHVCVSEEMVYMTIVKKQRALDITVLSQFFEGNHVLLNVS